MPKTLVIVESPAKARTIERILKDGYEVRASYGHVRDLPESADEIPDEIRKKKWGRLGVDTDGDFTPYYVIPNDKKKYVQALRASLKGATQVFLATDPDREGESISWHLREILKTKVPVKRIVFHEITEDAIREAVQDAHDVDENLVRAQESRRILDRLYGYTLSPVLWKKVQTGLSAGRVQSVAVRLIVDREEERLAFRPATYWDLEARLSGEGREFTATLAKLGAERVATGKDFDSKGTLTGKNARVLTEPEGRTLVAALWQHLPWTVTAVDEKPGVERPAPPFTTSTLTQEASRKLGFSTERTMQAAQRLFQEGLISYHRTDSTTLSEKALAESAAVIRGMFGDDYYSGPRRYATKVKNAQEAHEAIRPSNFGSTPASLETALDRHDLRVYELIWKRTMASQMVDARVQRTTVEVSGTGVNGETAIFTASGKAIEFAGFRRAYVEGSDDPAAELEEQETVLPKLTVGEKVERADDARVRAIALEPKRHDTAPPARYTEASLIKELERLGIGRPSTYAATIGTIERRGYVFRQGKALVPSFTAFAVTHLLVTHFGDLVDVEFTAEMEEDLDQISRGEREWLDFIGQFYRGDSHHRGLEEAVRQAEERADYPLIDVGVDPETNENIRVRIGRYGPFLQMGEGGPGKTASLPPTQAPADLSVEKALTLIRAKAEGPRVLGVDPKTGMNVYAIHGRFGAYVQLGETPEKGSKEKPKRSSLTGALTESTVSLDDALKLLELPRELGVHPESGQPVVAGLGRFGPYVKHGDDYRSLASEDDLFTVGLERALALFAEPKRSGRRQATKRVIRQIDATDKGPALQVLEGRYGPYVTDGETNASVPRGTDPATLSLEDARALLDARRGAPSRPGRRRRTASAAPKKRRASRGAALPEDAAIGLGSQDRAIADQTQTRTAQDAALMRVRIVGGGLAGAEAAWQIASRGVPVTLYEMRPVRPTAVHKTDRLAELVCSNSFRGDKLDNAVGLLKEEMRRLGSLVMRAAEASRVPAGAALAVDRDRFAETITRALADHPLVTIVREEVTEVPPSTEREPVIVATGPLTSEALSADIARIVGGDHLYFYDAISPIVLAETIDRRKVFRASRWDRSLRTVRLQPDATTKADGTTKIDADAEIVGGVRLQPDLEARRPDQPVCGVDDGEGDYLNCPLTRDEYDRFYDALVTAESATVHDFDKEKFFEGCLPIEVMAHRGRDTLRFGPMKPVGLTDPRTGREAYAVVQLRQDNLAGDHFSLVGFQTQIKWGEQARVLRLIPGLENAEFVRFGMVHRNTYVNGPRVLAETWQVRGRPTLFFAGQMSGVEGYVESAASGLLAGLNAAALAKGEAVCAAPRTTAIGALAYYVAHANPAHYEPSNITFGIMQPLTQAPRGKKLRNLALSDRALADLEQWLVLRQAQHERIADPARPELVDQPPRSALRRSAEASAKAEGRANR